MPPKKRKNEIKRRQYQKKRVVQRNQQASDSFKQGDLGHKDLIGWDHPLLKQKSQPVDLENTGRSWLLGLYMQMRNVLHASNNGVGLAAPQIGIMKRVIMVWPAGVKGFMGTNMRKAPTMMINPEIVEYTGAKKSYREGCLSYPGVFTDVERYTRVIVKFDHIENSVHKIEATGLEAIVIQHEIDHLNGICRVGDYWRLTMKKEQDMARKIRTRH